MTEHFQYAANRWKGVSYSEDQGPSPLPQRTGFSRIGVLGVIALTWLSLVECPAQHVGFYDPTDLEKMSSDQLRDEVAYLIDRDRSIRLQGTNWEIVHGQRMNQGQLRERLWKAVKLLRAKFPEVKLPAGVPWEELVETPAPGAPVLQEQPRVQPPFQPDPEELERQRRLREAARERQEERRRRQLFLRMKRQFEARELGEGEFPPWSRPGSGSINEQAGPGGGDEPRCGQCVQNCASCPPGCNCVPDRTCPPATDRRCTR